MRKYLPSLVVLCVGFALVTMASTEVIIKEVPKSDRESWNEWLLTPDGETYQEKRENWNEVCEGTPEVCEEGLREIDFEAELEFEIWSLPPVEPPIDREKP